MPKKKGTAELPLRVDHEPGSFIPARPTVYKGIQMRSRLEADYAAHLDRTGQEWEYEPTCFGSDKGQWLPDFRIGEYGALTELKPAGALSKAAIPSTLGYERYVDAHLAKMTVAWASEPTTCLQLVYWNYGGPEELVVYSAGKSQPWLARPAAIGDAHYMLWPGMGQFNSLYAAGRGA